MKMIITKTKNFILFNNKTEKFNPVEITLIPSLTISLSLTKTLVAVSINLTLLSLTPHWSLSLQEKITLSLLFSFLQLLSLVKSLTIPKQRQWLFTEEISII